MVGFIFGGKTGLTYADLQDQRTRADLLASQILGKQPKTVAEGLGSVLQGIGVGVSRYRADRGTREGQQKSTSGFEALRDRILGGGGASGNLPMPGAAAEMSATSPSGGASNYRDAIASIESAGSGDYAAVGPRHPKMGRALGRYQVMESNIGPWSQAALGRQVSADEFMANPQLQDAIFDHQFGQYVQKYGPEGAAQAWFGGPGGVGKLDRKDSLGTTIAAYSDKFNKAMGGNQVASLDPSIGMPEAAAQIERTAPGSGYVDPMVSAPNAMPQAANVPLPNQSQAGNSPMLSQIPQQQAAVPPMPAPQTVSPPPQVAAQPQQVAQAPAQQLAQPFSGIDPQLFRYANDPFLPEEMRAEARMLLEQQMQQQQSSQEDQRWRARQEYERQQKQADPAYQIDLQKSQLELDALRNPTPGYRVLSSEEKQALGLPTNGSFQIGQTGKIEQVGGSGVTINNEGSIPAGYQANRDAEGRVVSIAPIPGSPAALEAEATQNATTRREQSQSARSNLVTQEIDRAIGVMDSGILPDTGMGAMLSGIPGTDAKRLSGLFDTIKANIGFAELNKMRQESPTGGALGSVTERELQYLQAVAGSLDQSQDEQTLRDNLNRLWNAYQDVVHGEGGGPPRRALSFQQQDGSEGNTPPAPSSIDPEDWKFMTPEERRLFQ